jgi:hypothetical protein
MLIRRNLVLGAGAGAGLAAVFALKGCSSRAGHAEAAQALRRPFAADGTDRSLLMGELVRFATLAPSSHNTQCWRFSVQPGGLRIEADLSRRCPVVDPDDHHLFVSLGCAAENLAQAALARGLMAQVALDDTGAAVAIGLEPTKALDSPLFQAVTARQCTRADYDAQPLSAQELRLLERAGSGPGVRVLLLTARAAMEQVLEHVVVGNTAQLQDQAFMAELKSWIRFSDDEAMHSGDGLFAGCTGNPALPRWLGSRMMDLIVTPSSDNERYAKQVRSSAGVAVFVSDTSDKAHWLEVGRAYERFALQATILGIRNAMLNQPVEVGAVRPDFARALGLGEQRPDLVVRFGRGPVLPWSMRRPLPAVMA